MTIPEGCPWYEAQQSYGPPNVNWCEETQCTWINEPMNTWSNLGFIIVALALIYRFNKKNSALVSGFAMTVIVMGTLSFTYHATNNYLSQFFDFVGMSLMSSFLISFNIQRTTFQKHWGFWSVYWFFVFINTLLFALFGMMDIPVQVIQLINFAPVFAMEIYLGTKEGRWAKNGYFGLAFVSLVIALSLSIADHKRIYCNPDGWLHGHVLWHIMCAVAMLFIGLHLRSFKDFLGKRA